MKKIYITLALIVAVAAATAIFYKNGGGQYSVSSPAAEANPSAVSGEAQQVSHSAASLNQPQTQVSAKISL